MNKLIRAFRVSAYELRGLPKNYRILIGFALLAVYLHYIISPLCDFALENQKRISFASISFILSDWRVEFFLMMGTVLLFCDVPFYGKDQIFLISRSGWLVWFFGQVVYVFILASIYVIIILVLFGLILLPCLQWSVMWDSVILTLAEGLFSEEAGILIDFSKNITLNYSASDAFILSLFLFFMGVLCLASLILLCNTCLIRGSGILVGFFFDLLVVLSKNSYPIVTFFSPLSWCSINVIDITNSSPFPSLSYVIIGYSLIVFLCIGVGAFFVEKKLLKTL